MIQILLRVIVTSLFLGFASTAYGQNQSDRTNWQFNGNLGVDQIQMSASASSDRSLQKLDADLKRLVRTSQQIQLMGLDMQPQSASGNVRLFARDAANPKVDILIRIQDNTAPESIATPGMTIRTQAGNIVVARIPINELVQLIDTDGIVKVEASRINRPLHDESRAAVNVNAVHQGDGLDQAYKGNGVVVGVLDSGIDFTHPDFSNENGTRIQYLLEYLDEDNHDEDYYIWTKDEIDNDPGSITQTDGDGGGGHGTHVAGSAAGGGKANSAMAGMAPESDIIFVNGTRDDNENAGFGDADIIGGVQYIFDRAEEMGKPAVVNLSLGGNQGSLDGKSATEEALSNLAGPGRIIVAAAGNEGHDLIHAGHEVAAGETYTVMTEYGLRVNGWTDPNAVARYSVGIFSIDGGNIALESTTDWVSHGDWEEDMILTVDGTDVASVLIYADEVVQPENGDDNVFILAQPVNDVDLDDYIFGIIYEGNEGGRADFWSLQGTFVEDEVGLNDATQILGDRLMTVGSPATAEKVISVAAFTSKNEWVDINGNTQYEFVPQRNETFGDWDVAEVGAIAHFSSRGPTRDGRLGTDIAAPGEKILSTKSSHLSEGEGYEADHVMEGGSYLAMQGTSMASPHIAGIIALMLEADPTLDYDRIIEIFQETSVADNFTGTLPNHEFGHGKVDAQAAVKAVEGDPTSADFTDGLPDAISLKQNYPNPFNPVTVISYELPNQSNVRISVYDMLGRNVAVLVDENMSAGAHQVTFDAANFASGMYLYRLETADMVLTRKMMLIK